MNKNFFDFPELSRDVNSLKCMVQYLEPKSQSFAKSLCDNYDKYTQLSERQIFYVVDMLTKAEANFAAQSGKNDDNMIEVGKIDILSNLFNNASKSGLKFPGITVELPEVGEVLISAPEKKTDTHVDVYIRKKNGANKYKYLGSVYDDGWFELYKAYHSVDDKIVKTLKDFSKDPLGTAIAYGKMTGMCCFCNSGLTDDRSLKSGYGPVCAKNWGLPWGN